MSAPVAVIAPQATAVPAGEATIRVLRFDRVGKPGVLRGFATLHLVKLRLQLFGCACFSSDAGDWVLPPSRAMLDRDGKVRRDGGKPVFVPMLSWDSRAVQSAFSAAAIAALDRFDPGWREGGR
jgi:hypothetical protein